MFGVLMCSSLFMNVCKFTVSNALDMSRAIASVLCGGLCWLNLFVIVLFILCNAVVVECCLRKPCWCVFGVKFEVSWGRKIFSRFLAIGDKRAIGRYNVPIVGSLLGFGIGIIFASFQNLGIVLVFIAVLYICVRYCIARGPRCWMCLWRFWSVL